MEVDQILRLVKVYLSLLKYSRFSSLGPREGSVIDRAAKPHT